MNDAPSLDDTLRVVAELFVLVRTVASHGERHPMSATAAEALVAAITAAGPPITLQFVLGGVFRDRQLVPMDAERYAKVEYLSRALRHAGVAELGLHAPTSAAALLSLAAVLARSALAPGEGLESQRLAGVSWREIPHARRGLASESIAAEVAAAMHLALAIGDAERLERIEGAWPWANGVAVIRRLERARDASSAGTLFAVELAPGPWGTARRAVSAALHTWHVLLHAGVARPVGRAAAHATLLLACAGFPEGMPAAQAAQRALTLAMADDRLRVEPHHLKVLSLVIALADAERALAPAGLVELCYELDRRRVPAQGAFVLTRADLLAHAVADRGRSYDERWVRGMIAAIGVVPPGSLVRLPDGRLGVVLGPGPTSDPWMPQVLVQGEVHAPSGRVELTSSQPRVAPMSARQQRPSRAPR